MTPEKRFLGRLKQAGYILMAVFIIFCTATGFLWLLGCFTENRYVWFLAGSVYASIAGMIGNEKPGEE
ncbi:MAG: hypothetical protein LBP69_09525 [Treponema sp.]|jgi:hypothetical protein|nr:hypothetical protein [Treponema sp.]